MRKTRISRLLWRKEPPASEGDPLVEIYSKEDCCLCEEAKIVVQRVRKEIPFHLRVIDITANDALLEKFGQQVPVVFIDKRKAFKFRLEDSELREKLERARRSSR